MAEEPDLAGSTETVHIGVFSEQAQGRTDSSGRLRLGPVGPGNLHLTASADGFFEDYEGQKVPAPALAQAPMAATLRLERGHDLRGRVLMPDGTPAAAARVTLKHHQSSHSASYSHAHTDPEGSFGFTDLGGGRYSLEALLLRDDHYEASLDLARRTTEATLTLSRGTGARRLVAVVLDPEGDPIPSAESTLHGDRGAMSGRVEHGRVAFGDMDEFDRDFDPVWIEIEYARGHDGALLPLGRVRRHGLHWGQTVEIRLPPELTIEGRIIAPDGTGVPNARVRANPIGPPGEDYPKRDEPMHWRLAHDNRTDPDGRYRIGHLGEGAHRVFVLPPTEFAPPAPVEAEAGARDVNFAIRPAAVVALRIHAPDGNPLPGARVRFAKASDDPSDLVVANLLGDYGPGTEVVAGDDGIARIHGLDASASYALGVQGPTSRADLADHVDAHWSPADATISLALGLTVSGVVREGKAGAPLQGARVTCSRSNGVYTSTHTGEDGAFRFTGLSPGKVTLEAMYGFDDRDLRVRTSKRVDAGAKDVVLALYPKKR
jgi:protocatechuate 3,4-dioxygenase beta subunit